MNNYMYVVEAKSKTATASREFKRIHNALKAAYRALLDGYVTLNISELTKEQRRFPFDSVHVYRSDDPDHYIRFHWYDAEGIRHENA